MNKFRILIFVLALAVLFAVGLFIGLFLPRLIPKQAQPRFNPAVVIQQIQTLAQLVTVKYVMEKVIIAEDVKWYGESRVLLVAHGVVKAGIDLQKLNPTNFVIGEKSIVMTLPKPTITDVYIDDKRTEVLERTTGVMRKFDKDLEQNARRHAVDEFTRAARLNGILQDADDRAKTQLTAILKAAGFEEVVFKRSQ